MRACMRIRRHFDSRHESPFQSLVSIVAHFGMGVLLGRLLAGANSLVGVAGAARGLQLFGELPISCNVPLRFGL